LTRRRPARHTASISLVGRRPVHEGAAKRHAPFNYVAILGMVVAPVVAIVGLADDPGEAPFILAAIGLARTVAGPLLVSNPRRGDVDGLRASSHSTGHVALARGVR
jgi:hypothetical protein